MAKTTLIAIVGFVGAIAGGVLGGLGHPLLGVTLILVAALFAMLAVAVLTLG